MILRSERKRNRRAAFTLMEMLVVVAIIVALAGIGTYYLIPMLAAGQRDTAHISAENLSKVVFAYKVRHHTWPDSLQQLTQPDAKGAAMLEPNDLKDPWGGTFQYDKAGAMNQGRRPDIYTIDTSDGTKVGNWQEQQ